MNKVLPKNWKYVKLGDAVQVLDNLRKPINSSERQKRIAGIDKQDLFPYYGATGQVGWIDDFITDGEYILVGEDGAPFLDNFKEKAYKVKGKTWVNNHAHILKEIQNITINDFILHYLNSINYRQYVNGTTRLKLTKGSLVEIPFPLPPKPIQLAIVSKIEELFSELDKGIESLLTAKQQLKTYRQSVLKWAFEGKLTYGNGKDGEFPKGWEWVKIFEIAKIETGTTPSKSNPAFYGHEYPFYKPTDLEAGENVYKSTDGLTKLGVDAARYVPENSTLVTCIGATIGKTGLIKKGGGFNQQINAIIPKENMNPRFVYYQTIGLNFQKQILANASATTLPIINKGKFQILEMAVCPIEDQHNIVRAIESRFIIANKMEESIIQSLQQAKALKQSILKKAFEGKLIL